jgi:hypothetical protein
MRRAVLVLAFAGCVRAANSQLTILPQAGLENPTTKISYNNLSYFSPVDQLQPQFGVRADYKFKGGFAPFLGLATSRSGVSYSFTDPDNGMTAYNASLGKTQLQIQGGLQYSSKPLYFKQKSSSTSSKTTTSEETYTCHSFYSSCSRYSSSCCHKSSSEQKAKPQKQSWSMRIQPSAGFGYVPSSKSGVVTETSGGQPSYTYNAGNMKTALLTGVGFEFAKGKSRLFTLSVNYFKGLSNNESTLTTESVNKTTTTMLNSKVSGWNASLGIPIDFSKKPSSTTHKTKHSSYDCQQYRMEHRYRCGKVI